MQTMWQNTIRPAILKCQKLRLSIGSYSGRKNKGKTKPFPCRLFVNV